MALLDRSSAWVLLKCNAAAGDQLHMRVSFRNCVLLKSDRRFGLGNVVGAGDGDNMVAILVRYPVWVKSFARWLGWRHLSRARIYQKSFFLALRTSLLEVL